jgi:hypothetical protein
MFVAQMSPPQPRNLPAGKRVGPPAVPPLTLDGVRYETLHRGRERGLGQNGGYLLAIDAASGRELWTLHVYAVPHDPAEEFDAQEVFITETVIDVAANVLLLKNENRRSFRINLADRSVAENS